MRNQHPSRWLGAVAFLSLQIPSVVGQLYNTVIKTAYGSVKGVRAFNSTPAGNITNWQDITVWKGST